MELYGREKKVGDKTYIELYVNTNIGRIYLKPSFNNDYRLVRLLLDGGLIEKGVDK